MPYKDLREFIAVLEKQGDAVRVEKEVDANLEVGAITRRVNETQSPAPFFQKIKGYAPEYRIFGSPLATLRRLATALEINPDASYSEILDRVETGWKRQIKPRVVKDGPCKENIYVGEDVDLYKLPSPVIHEGDGGPYLGTWGCFATPDLDSDWQNWGMYRNQVFDKNTLGVYMEGLRHHGLMYYAKYEPRNMAMPFALAIGPEPICTLAACTSAATGVSEVDIACGLRGEPVDLVKCETNDLLVPATSEIVIEGEIPPHERRLEGPFGEGFGYMTPAARLFPFGRVKAVTHRNNPILTVSNMGTATDEGDVAYAVNMAIEVRGALLKAGIPITGVYIPTECCSQLTVVSTKNTFSGIANRIANCIWGSTSNWFARVVVVGEDVDPSDMKEVLHTWMSQCHPVRGITVMGHATGTTLQASLSMEDRKVSKGANVVFDCLFPIEWPAEAIPKKASFKAVYPKELQEKVVKGWTEYGFK